MTHDTIVRDLLEAGEFRSNRLTAAEYDETTWSARTWLSFVFQRLSVAVHKLPVPFLCIIECPREAVASAMM